MEQVLLDWILIYGPVAVFLAMILEEVIFVIPSSVITISAGAFLVDSEAFLPAVLEMSLEVVLPASLGITLGSFFVFYILYFGGKEGLERYGGYLNLSWHDIEKFKSYLNHDRQRNYILALRAVPIVPITTVSAASGFFHVDRNVYTVWTFIGISVRNFLYALIGWTAGSNLESIISVLNSFSGLFSGTVLALIIFYLLQRSLPDNIF